MREILVDIRYASRVLTSAPVTSAVAVLSLALAVAGAASVFAVIDAFVFRTLPVAQPHRLVSVSMATRDGAPRDLSVPMFRAFAARQRVFSYTTGWVGDLVLNVEAGGQTGLANVWAVTDEFFATLGEPAAHGRVLEKSGESEGDAVPPDSVVIGDRLWRERFGSDPAVIGQTIRIEGRPFTVIGVSRPKFTGPSLGVGIDATVPLAALPRLREALGHSTDVLTDPTFVGLAVGGRLADGIDVTSACAQLDSWWQGMLHETVPAASGGRLNVALLDSRVRCTSAAHGVNADVGAALVRPFYCRAGPGRGGGGHRGAARGPAAPAVDGAADARPRRTAGAGRLALATGAARAGAWCARRGHGRRGRNGAGVVGQSPDARADRRPRVPSSARRCRRDGAGARRVRHTGRPADAAEQCGVQRVRAAAGADVARDGRDASNGRADRHRGQRAPCLADRDRVGPGHCRVYPEPDPRYVDGWGRRTSAGGSADVSPHASARCYAALDDDAYYRALVEQVAVVPGVVAAGLSIYEPGGAWQYETRVTLAGPESSAREAVLAWVSPGFLDALEVPLWHGRDFIWSDTRATDRVAIVSAGLAQALFPDGDALGRHIHLSNAAAPSALRIVGIAPDARVFDLCQAAQPTVYVPWLQAPSEYLHWANTLVLRHRGDEGRVVAGIREAVSGLDRE